jgi:hypothetical protein
MKEENFHMTKKEQEILNKKIESSLFQFLDDSSEPFWLILLLIENSKDFSVNKYNTSACLIAKLFEKWLNLPQNIKRLENFKPDESIKKEALLISTRYNLQILEYLVKPYQLHVDNNYLIEIVKKKIDKLDFKDKAILIGTTCLHEHFDYEEVNLLN